MVEFEEDQLEPLPLDGMYLPRIRLTLGEDAPYFQVKVGEQAYQYEKSYPIKGHSATLPKFAREGHGRRPQAPDHRAPRRGSSSISIS